MEPTALDKLNEAVRAKGMWLGLTITDVPRTENGDLKDAKQHPKLDRLRVEGKGKVVHHTEPLRKNAWSESDVQAAAERLLARAA